MWPIFSSKFLRRWKYKFKYLFFLEICIIGLASGLSAVLLKEGIDFIGEWRIHLAEQYPAWIVLPAIGLFGGLIAGWLVHTFAPTTAGSGIPQVKAYIEGVRTAMNLRVAVVKLVGATIALGSGFVLGREGPTIQMSAACAAYLSRRLSNLSNLRCQIVAAGAGAGLAAAFNAPIAGVLFVVEELRKDASSFTFGTAILGSFVGSVVARELGAHSIDIDLAAAHTNFSAREIPFYLLLGLLAGLLGSLFNEGIIASLKFYQNRMLIPFPLKVALAGLVTGVVLAFVPITFRDHAGLQEILESANVNWQLATSAFSFQFILTLVDYGSGAPGGLFAPSLTLGASIGHLVGLGAQFALGDIDWQVTYALAGMGAFFCAAIRVPITAITIIFEMTQDFNLVLPLMISCIFAYFVAERLSPGSLYDRLLELSGISLSSAEEQLPSSFVRLRASDLMTRSVETLNYQTNMAKTIAIFAQSNHRGFPVVDDHNNLVGIVTQKDINEFLWQQNMTSVVKPEEVLLSQVMTRSPITVNVDTPLLDVIYLLYQQDLSRLPVMDGDRLVGLITRTDLIRVEANYIQEI